VTDSITYLPEAVASEGALPVPGGPGRPSTEDLVAAYEAIDFAELMVAESAVIVSAVCDPLVAEVKRLQRQVADFQAEQDRCDAEYAKAIGERDALQKRLHNAAMTRTWRNEDGKKFVFVEDIAPALLGIEPDGGGQQ
jgi:hypothetical protein